MDGAVVALAALVVLIIVMAMRCGRRDRFVSRQAQEVYNASKQLFGQTQGGATYSEFKTSTKQADPVLYTDVRKLWREGGFTPENVQKVL